jgi:hypothetical protein
MNLHIQRNSLPEARTYIARRSLASLGTAGYLLRELFSLGFESPHYLLMQINAASQAWIRMTCSGCNITPPLYPHVEKMA